MKKFFSKLSKKINIKKDHQHHIVLGFFAFLSLFVVIFFNSNEQAISSQSQNLSGYAFSTSENVGWISFNCTDGGLNGDSVCGSTDYGVNIDSTTGNIVGYAWSPNYGWLKFGGLNTADMPTGGGTTQVNARKVGNNIEGWARFCSAALNADCTGNRDSESSYTGGWDGWVSLRGETLSEIEYGVSTTAGDYLTGYAWGGDDDNKNIGWIDFSKVKYVPISGPVVSLSAPSYVLTGSQVPITWSGVNLQSNATGCTATGSVPGWAGQRVSPGSSWTTPALSQGSYNLSIQCMGVDGITFSNVSSVTIYVGSYFNFSSFPMIVSATNPTTQLSWSPIDLSIVGCVASGDWVGNKTPSGTDSFTLTESQTYSLTCSNNMSGSATINLPVPYNIVGPTISLSHSGVRPSFGGGYYTDINWETSGVDSGSCVKTSTPSTNWMGSVLGVSGRQTGVTVPVSSPLFTTYTLTCTMTNPASVSTDQCLTDADPTKICHSLDLNENSTASSSIKLPVFREN